MGGTEFFKDRRLRFIERLVSIPLFLSFFLFFFLVQMVLEPIIPLFLIIHSEMYSFLKLRM